MITLLLAAALAQDVCQNTAFTQDLNCNLVDVSQEAALDWSEPSCESVDSTWNTDWFYDHANWGCSYPVVGFDGDHDGLSQGTLALETGEGVTWAVIQLDCDNCGSISNPDQLDTDCDEVGDVCDNCPDVPNHGQSDVDGDGVGDACDTCPYVPNAEQDPTDTDEDGISDTCDNCPEVPNAEWSRDPQEDFDEDGFGDACDVCPLDADDQADAEGDGIGDACDVCPDHEGTVCDRSLDGLRGGGCQCDGTGGALWGPGGVLLLIGAMRRRVAVAEGAVT